MTGSCLDDRRSVAVLLALLIAVYVGYNLPLLPVGADDMRLASLLSLDESLVAGELKRLLGFGILNPPSHLHYGWAYYDPPLIVLNLWSLFGEVTERATLLTIRAYSLIVGVGCLIGVYQLGRLLFTQSTALVGALILATIPEYLRWSSVGHPDLPQLFWLIWALYLCCALSLEFTLKRVFLAGVLAGLAFSTKYSGLFLLPVISVVIVIGDRSKQWSVERLYSRRIWLAIIVCTTGFLLSFAVTSPAFLLNPGPQIDHVQDMRKQVRFGWLFQDEAGTIEWLWIFLGLVGWCHAGALLVYSLAGLARFLGGNRATGPQWVILLWIVVYGAYLLLEANIRRPRYLLPILPFMLLFVAQAYVATTRVIIGRYPTLRHFTWAVPLVLAGVLWQNGAQAYQHFNRQLHALESNDHNVLGAWLTDNYTEETTILYDAYAYVPSEFPLALRIAKGQNYLIVNHLEPDLVVAREGIEKDFEDVDAADRSILGRGAYLDAHYYYRYLREGRIPTYSLKKDFGSVAVYERTQPKRAEVTADVWKERVRLVVSREVYRAGQAREVMGDIHVFKGIWSEALREYELASQLEPEDIRIPYKLAAAQLYSGDKNAGKATFDEVLGRMRSRPGNVLARIYFDVAQKFAETNNKVEAVSYVNQAMALDPGHLGAHFSLGLYLLAAGDVSGADSAFTTATARFGHSVWAAVQLRSMSQGDRSGVAERMLKKHFGGAGRSGVGAAGD